MLAIAAYVAASHGQLVDEIQLRAGVDQMLRDPLGQLAFLASGQLAFFVVSVAAGAISPIGIRNRLQVGRSRVPIWTYLVLPAGMFAIGALLEAIVQALHIETDGSTLEMLDKTFSSMHGSLLAVSLVIAAIGPGIAEELLFRGYIQSRLAVRWGAIAAILVSATLFGAAHFDKLQSPMTYVMGLYLGLIAYRAGSIRPTMWCHAVNNAGAVLLAWHAGQAGGDGRIAPDTSQLLIQIVIALGVLGLCVAVLLLTTRSEANRQPSYFNH